jgi:APA family basic amino acid/polyamine antiporter
MIPFNVKKHSDITITVSGDVGDEKTFHLHKFPLISKSAYFDENIPDASSAPAPGPIQVELRDFPGGAGAFEVVARYCYGIDIELSMDNIAHVYCAARTLKVRWEA